MKRTKLIKGLSWILATVLATAASASAVKAPFPERYPIWQYDFRMNHRQLDEAGFQGWLKRLPDPRLSARLTKATPVEIAKRVSTSGSSELLGILKSSQGELRAWATIEACYRADRNALPILQKMAQAGDLTAGHGLVMFKDEEAWRELATSSNPELKLVRAVSLASLGDNSELSTIKKYLADARQRSGKLSRTTPYFLEAERKAWRRDFRQEAVYQYIRLSPRLTAVEIKSAISAVGPRYILPKVATISRKPVEDVIYGYASSKDSYARKWALMAISKYPESVRRTQALKKGLKDPWKDIVAVAKQGLGMKP